MDDFVQDPDLGPELFRFVSQKWKATREVLKASQDHNARLREEIQDLRNGGRESLVKEEVEPVNAEDDWEEDEQSRLLDITCRIGQCRPKNEAVSLAEKLKEANERIEALEQALQESVVNLEEMQKRYEQVKTKSKARRADILELRGRVQELEALQAPETLHVHAKQEEQAASLGASENPRTEDAAEETIVVSESRPAVTIPLDWVTQPCLRGGLRIFDVPKQIIEMACAGGILCWRERWSVDSINGTVKTYTPEARYKCGTANENERWISYNGLGGFIGKTREIFYVSHGATFYAGTFQASKDMGVFSQKEYQRLSDRLRQSLQAKCVVPAPDMLYIHLTVAEELAIANRYWSGQSRIRYLSWKRIGFNTMMYQAIMAHDTLIAQMAIPEKTVAESSQKRKSVEDHGDSSKKQKS